VKIKFTLSMPSNNSWNGKWSGASKNYFLVRSFRGLNACAKAQEILNHHSFFYNFGDGWGASIRVEECLGRPGKSDGFCAYDWMVESILEHGTILNDSQIEGKRAKEIAEAVTR
jgi:hypothetical protein